MGYARIARFRVPLLYPELRRLARGCLRQERSGHTLQTTALVHEAYARLVRQDHPDDRNRAHFMAIAARVMRQVLIDHARLRNAGKRGCGAVHAPVEEAMALIGVLPTAARIWTGGWHINQSAFPID